MTDKERKLYKEGEENYRAKKELSKIALRKQTPNDEESDLIHALWLKQSEYSGNLPPSQNPQSTLTPLRRKQRHAKARQRPLHVLILDPVRTNHATPISQQAQLHDLRWFPTEIHL